MNCVITPWGFGIATEARPVLLLMDLCLTTMVAIEHWKCCWCGPHSSLPSWYLHRIGDFPRAEVSILLTKLH